ncbi:RCC1 domain-containing protein [Micromonospora sp. HUAS LYJ1]|uniref:RCC1 domain-containing protein n=1 Tax=Micromonospora sp. HUAS LYJ1 TaxID=3061626 RepID=UPI00267253AD|nr:RCC1 domain-containing protein [Micromonospora sp. HUAS LYJ1]WKU07125.1 hypothetical protein Q2K16_08765 [Micromonospora sp. HUAS LYJ1]
MLATAVPAAAADPGAQVLAWGRNDDYQLGNGSNVKAIRPERVLLPAGVVITDIAVSPDHGLALTTTGSVYAWGSNYNGQLGDGTFTDRNRPVPVLLSLPAGVAVTDLVAGISVSLAMTSDGGLYGWGDGFMLATGSSSDRNLPVRVSLPGNPRVVSVSASETHVLAATSTGQVYGWGSNYYGQFGTGSTSSGFGQPPTLMSLPSGVRATQVAAGNGFSLVLTSTGQVYGAGNNNSGSLGDGTNNNSASPVLADTPAGTTFTKITASRDSALGLTSDGRVLGWGYFQRTSNVYSYSTRPIRVAGLPTDLTYTDIAAGYRHNLVRASTGRLYAWGVNGSGQLGIGNTDDQLIPVPLSLPGGARPIAIAAAGDVSLALATAAPNLAWGANDSGQLGNNTTTDSRVPVPVSLPATAEPSDIEGGYLHSLAATTDGDVLAWGSNAYGQLGDGTQTNRTAPVPVTLPGSPDAVEVAGGQYHSLALTKDGRVFAWGRNNRGQIGDGTTTDRLTPVQVSFPAGTSVTAIASHNMHNIAVTSTGQVYTWGDNTFGQIGDNTTTTRPTPTLIPLPGGATATRVAVGAFHSLAMTSTGTAFAWGYNNYGQLGNATNTNSSVPVPVSLPAGTTLRDIDAGLSHSLGITSTGRALAWGVNSVGQLGNGTTTNSNIPVSVHLPGGVTLAGLAGGESHSLAVTDTGQIMAWGLNNRGQLGDNTTTARLTPIYVNQPTGTTATGVAAGQFHSLAR